MSDPRAGNGYGTTGDDGQQGKLSKSAGAQPTSGQRGVRSTRTPATRTPTSLTPKDADAGPNPPQDPRRSQTVPMPAPSGAETRTRRTPGPTPTMPVPGTTTRQRTASNPKSQPTTGSSRLPELPNPHPEAKSSLVGTDYIVEPLSSFRSSEPRSSRDRERERQDPAYLSPHPPPPPSSIPMPSPMLATDNRQSVSSFQTPSSYYSVEDNWSSVGGNGPPMPQMPEHRHEEQAPEKRYEELWLAAHANTKVPPMPTPEVAPPSMPSPHHVDTHEEEGNEGAEEEEEWEEEYQEREDEEEEQEDHQWVPSREPQTRPYAPPKDRYDSSWLAAPSPGIPAPSVAPPPMPSPSVGQPQGSAHTEYPRPNSGPVRPGAGVGVALSTTAPLRVHHHPRPTGIGPMSTAPSSTTAQAPVQPSPQRPSFQPPSAGPTKPQVEQPSNVNPNIASSMSTPQKYSYETRPPGASAPSMPSAPTTNTIPKPVSVYAQHPQSNVPVKPQGAPASATMQGGRFEGRPTAPISTSTTTTAIPPQPPQKVTPVHNQLNNSLQPSRPTATAPISNAPQKTNTGGSQAQSTSSRPQAHISEPRPNRPSISGPQVQHQGSTSSSKEKEKEQAAAKEHAAASAATAANPTRPRLHGGTPSQNHTQYVNMLLALDDIPALYNLLAGFFTWILLAGFILFPGTFTSLQNLNGGTTGLPAQVEHQLINAVTHLPLFIVAWICTGIGGFGMIWLWWRWRKNYIWGLNKIFLPGFLNSLAGLLSTIANIFGVQHGELSTTSKSTVIVTTAATGALGILTLFYTFWLVRRVKARHDREVGKERAGKYGEGVVDLSKRR